MKMKLKDENLSFTGVKTSIPGLRGIKMRSWSTKTSLPWLGDSNKRPGQKKKKKKKKAE